MDIWALGIMMFLMIFGFHPFLTKKERETKKYEVKIVVQRIINDQVEIPLPALPKEEGEISSNGQDQEVPIITNECRNLLQSLLNKNPKERIQLSEV